LLSDKYTTSIFEACLHIPHKKELIEGCEYRFISSLRDVWVMFLYTNFFIYTLIIVGWDIW